MSFLGRQASTILEPPLPQGGFESGNWQVLCDWLADLPEQLEGAPSQVAAFDFDNTCIFGDIGDMAFRRFLDAFALRLSDEDLARLVPVAVNGVDAVDGVKLAAVRDDLLVAARQLRALVQPKADLVSLLEKPLPHDDAHADFCAKAMWLYGALSRASRVGPAWAYPWVARWFAGFSTGELEVAAAHIVRDAVGEPLGLEIWSARTPGNSGLLSAAVVTGLRPHVEMRDLMKACQAAGLRALIVSASLEPLVRGAAQALAFPVADDDVCGMRLAHGDYPITYGAGKAALLDWLGVSNVFAAGDADTDWHLLHRDSVALRLVINRNSHGRIRGLYDLARADRQSKRLPRQGNPVTLLQGRDENRGIFCDDQRTIPKGQATPVGF